MITWGHGMASTHAGGLIAELSRRAATEGGNTGLWPGLTIYRFTSPTGPTWEEIQSLSLCIVAQGRKAVTVDGATYEYDPFHYELRVQRDDPPDGPADGPTVEPTSIQQDLDII
jgi:hypothetical protein